MSRGFVKEGDQEEVPMVLPRAFLPKNVPNYVTEEGLKLLQEEMLALKQERASAGSNYVLKNYVDAKINLLSERLNSAVPIDVKNKKVDADVVSFGSYVKYNDKVIRIVGVDEADASKGLISFISPIAKALIGKKKGDKFEIKVPRGTETIEIQEVATFISAELRALSPEQSTVAESVEVASFVYERTRKEHENVGISCRDVTPVASSNENSCKSSTANSQQPKLPSTNSGTNPVTEPVEVAQSSTAKSQQPKFKVQDAPTDFLPIVNERGNIVGRALYCEIHNGNKVLHPAVHLLVTNSKNEIVGKYCWHVEFGETAEKTLKRKIVDVTSQNIKPKFKKQYLREDKNEMELVSVFTVVSDAEFLPSPDDKEYEAMFEKD